jgi:polyhydroxyalkanoate synthesis regulator phasin
MADENLEQRLAAIEAALPTLATTTHLDKIESEITKLNERVSDTLAVVRRLDDDVRFLAGLQQGMAQAGIALAGYVQQLAERVARLEDRRS